MPIIRRENGSGAGTQSHVRCAECGEPLGSGAIVCPACEWRLSAQHPSLSAVPERTEEILRMLKRARYTMIVGIFVFPWILEPIAFVTAAVALKQSQSLVVQPNGFVSRAVVILLASAGLAAFYWVWLVRLLVR